MDELQVLSLVESSDNLLQANIARHLVCIGVFSVIFQLRTTVHDQLINTLVTLPMFLSTHTSL